MSSTKKIAFLTPSLPVLRAEMQSLLPPGFMIEFADVNEKECHRQLLKDADYVFLGASYLDAELIQGATKLKMIQKWGIGVDKIDLQAAKARDIPVAITNGSNAAQVAEQAVLLMLATLRRLSYAQKSFMAGKWPNTELRTTCLQLTGKTVGLFGFGNIARQVAKQLHGFDAKIIYHSRQRVALDIEQRFKAEYVDFDTLLRQSDVLSLHAPFNAQTKDIISNQAFQKMKRSAIIVNTARGELIDEPALVQAIKEHRIFGAGLDVFVNEPPQMNNPLFSLDNVVVTPHAGASVKEAVTKIVQHGFNNILLFENGQPLDPADLVE
jgi:D-3-phosphoglycerate dehydrogenase